MSEKWEMLVKYKKIQLSKVLLNNIILNFKLYAFILSTYLKNNQKIYFILWWKIYYLMKNSCDILV